MSGIDLAGLLVLLAVFVFGPLFLMLFGSNQAHGPKPALHECPHCGAQNRATSPRCYCCDHEFILPESPQVPATVIQLVRKTDVAKAKMPAPTRSAPATRAA
jgi:hypothetical protein